MASPPPPLVRHGFPEASYVSVSALQMEHPSSPPKSLGAEQLLALAPRVRAGMKKSDSLSNDPLASLAGSQFTFERRPLEWNWSRVWEEVTWKYDPAKQEISFDTNISDRISVASTSHRGGSYVGSNAFGVRARVDVTNESDESILIPLSEGGTPGHPRVHYEAHLGPAQARDLTRRVVLRVAGELGPNGREKSLCSTNTDTATLGDPHEKRFRFCNLPGRLTHLEFIDSSDGSVLAEWTAPGQKP